MKKPFIGILTLDDQVTAPSAATVALAGAAGVVDNGAHRVKVTFVTAVGETEAGTQSAAVTVVDQAVDGQVAITNIPVSSSALVTGRNVYMTKAGGSTYYLLSNGVIANNTATTLTANDADATLNGATVAPSANTTTKATSLNDLFTTAGYAGMRIFSQVMISNVGDGSVVLSTNADIAQESAGFSIGDSANFPRNGAADHIPINGQYLFSETVGKQVSIYARPVN